MINQRPKIHLSSTLVSNVIYNYLGFFVISISGFLLFPFSLHILGSQANGVGLLVNSIIGYFGILDLGVGTTVMKMVAEHAHDNNKKDITKIVVNSLVIFTIIGILIILLGLCVTPFLDHIFKIPRSLVTAAKFVYSIDVI